MTKTMTATKKYLFLVAAIAVVSMTIPFASSAQEGYRLGVEIPGAPQEIAHPGEYISAVYRFGLGIAGLLALGMIIFGAVQYTVSAGNPSMQDDAKKRILNAIYGLILLVAAFLILYTINPNLVNLGRLDVEQASLPPLAEPPTEQEDRPAGTAREFSEARNRAFQALGLPEVALGRPLPEGISEAYQEAIDRILTGKTEISLENLTLIADAQERELAWLQASVNSALERDLRSIRMGNLRTHDETIARVRRVKVVEMPRLTNNLTQLQQLRSQLQSPPQETPAEFQFLMPDYQF